MSEKIINFPCTGDFEFERKKHFPPVLETLSLSEKIINSPCTGDFEFERKNNKFYPVLETLSLSEKKNFTLYWRL